MAACTGWIIAAVGVTAAVLLWFRDVRRVMRERKSTVECACRQLSANRKKAAEQPAEEMEAVLERSKDIYGQAVAQYNSDLQRPWNKLPARVMGYRPL